MSMKQKEFQTLFVFSADMGDLARSTVMGLPAETVGPAEVPDVPAAGEVLPQRTAPGLEFGKEVGSAAGFSGVGGLSPQSYLFPSHLSSFLRTSQESSLSMLFEKNC